jgi:hypothetical protein
MDPPAQPHQYLTTNNTVQSDISDATVLEAMHAHGNDAEKCESAAHPVICSYLPLIYNVQWKMLENGIILTESERCR